jgi:hypothetical protein
VNWGLKPCLGLVGNQAALIIVPISIIHVTSDCVLNYTLAANWVRLTDKKKRAIINSTSEVWTKRAQMETMLSRTVSWHPDFVPSGRELFSFPSDVWIKEHIHDLTV